VPNDQTSHLESCGNTAFRETEVTIDGKPAGVAPVYPWIYTGGIDPYLWEPIPGVQTLDFKPYRVDLTPFAGVLDDGNPHTIGVGVYNANSYFLATANLLVYTDHRKQKITGGILSNTLAAAPSPVVTENITTGAGPSYTGSILVTSKRNFRISGYVNTSHGRVETTVQQKVDFRNRQEFDVNATTDDQNAQQLTTVDSETNTRGGYSSGTLEKHFSYPININYAFVANPDGTYTQTASVDQQDLVKTSQQVNRYRAYESNLSNVVKAADTLTFDANFNVTGSTGSNTTQTYRFHDSFGHCYDRTLTAADHVLTNVSGGYCGDHH
jgi:hypothetical protein